MRGTLFLYKQLLGSKQSRNKCWLYVVSNYVRTKVPQLTHSASVSISTSFETIDYTDLLWLIDLNEGMQMNGPFQ